MKYMAHADPEIKNQSYMMDETTPILWYAVDADKNDCSKFIIGEILPELYAEKSLKTTDIIWIPSQQVKEITCFKEDMITVMDGATKIHEFHLYYDMDFKICVASHGFGLGAQNQRANVEIERFNIALSSAAYYLLRRQFVDLADMTLIGSNANPKRHVPTLKM